MTTYNTGNPVGSTAVKDIFDNSENLDKALNDQEAATWTDRLGRERKTYAELERLADPGTALDAAARAEEAADRAAAYDNLQVYLSYDSPSDKRMIDDTDQPVGTLGRVTMDADPGKNGDYVMTATGWEWAELQPASTEALGAVSSLASNALDVASSPAVFNGDFAVEPADADPIEFSITGESGRSIASFYPDGGWAYPWQGEFATEPWAKPIEFAHVCRKTGRIFLAYDPSGKNVIGGGLDFSTMPTSREILGSGNPYRSYQHISMLPSSDSFVQGTPSAYLNNSATFYTLLDALIDEFPDYLQKTVLAQDSVGNDIIMIRAVPAGYWTRWYPQNAPEALAKPKVVLLGGTHGNEKAAALSNYQLLREMCKRWKEDDRLGFLRWGMDLVYIPIVTPSGFNNTQAGNYLNANGVNINRNFPYRWDTADSFKGPSPASEIETQTVIALLEQHSDACVVIDHHNAGSLNDPDEPYAVWIGTETGKTIEIGRVVADHMMMFGRREFPEIDQTNSKIIRLVDSFDGTCSKHVQLAMGFAGFTLETGLGVRAAGQTNNLMGNQIHALEALTTLIYECVKNEIERRKRETVLPTP